MSFEGADPGHPLCRITQATTAEAVVRIHDGGALSGRVHATIALAGPETAGDALLADLRARPGHEVEVLLRSPRATWLRVSEPLDAPGPSLLALPVALAKAGWAALLEPMVVSHGQARGRIVVPAGVDADRIVSTFSELQRACGFAQLRVVRVGEVEPRVYTSLARRVLAPDQDEILALANEMGYYDTPKSVTLGEIADVVGLSVSPVHKRLKAAEERLVHLQVEEGPQERMRRPRRDAARVAGDAPWEAGLRVRAATLGPASILANHPEARALIVPQAEDRARGACSLMMLLTAPPDVQARVRTHLAERPEVAQVQTLAQDRQTVFYRFSAQGPSGYGLAAWCETLGSDAPIRSIVVDGDEATIRFIVLKPTTSAALEAKVRACAKLAGWGEPEILWIHPARERPPPTRPEPLTARQSEVLRVATALGYYRTPRGCTLEGVASTLGVSANAIHKNLVLAESKLIASYLAASL